MTQTLRIADGLTLPLDAVTQTFLIVGKRGSGKSNTAAPVEDFPLSSRAARDERPPEPPVRTESLITEATVKAIRSIDIAAHVRIQRLNVEPEYSIGDDGHLLSAEVTVKFSMIFPRED